MFAAQFYATALQAHALRSFTASQKADDITAFESHYFAQSNGAAPPDLQAIAAKWGMPGDSAVAQLGAPRSSVAARQ
ncbi:hypothetical protein Mal15_14480 [Stieleria maiorica]|uniref:Uncharacterized protein n=1 Tax=Stieleria maiorica TaxID=2795974 RepID=A0A5B9M886_9BACT|nr:hypothetical protein [Stieleria maiorica]QEF97408.1 hypothetical protein Mal15_14480 [Stieleria maiorica]